MSTNNESINLTDSIDHMSGLIVFLLYCFQGRVGLAGPVGVIGPIGSPVSIRHSTHYSEQ